MSVRLHFHGAAQCVTGACFRIETERAQVLIDCGLFQGSKTVKALNYEPFPFDPAGVEAVLLTHAHIDHSGQIPRLQKHGFRGPVYATRETCDLSGVLLPDAGGIQEHEVAFLNRRNQRQGREAVQPIYTRRDAERGFRAFQPVGYETWIDVAAGIRARWWNAGHILGSASIEVEIERDGQDPLQLLFSGDLGPGGRDFARDPRGPEGVDHVIVETTYGGEERTAVDPTARRRLLAQEVRDAHRLGGPLLIPAFAVERTQELLVDLLQIMADQAAPPAPIFIDSPLAIEATKVFLRHGSGADGFNPFEGLNDREILRPTPRAEQSRALERISGWHIILAGSGMCDAGRIRHHLRRLLWRRETTVLLTGFQAVGTLGRLLQEGAGRVKVQGESVLVRAAVRSLDVYSGHADAAALQSWLLARLPVRGSVFLTHGEPESIAAFGKRLRGVDLGGARVVTPDIDAVVRFGPGETAEPVAGAQPRLAPGTASSLDWHNARAALLLELERRLQGAADDRARARLIDRLAKTLAA